MKHPVIFTILILLLYQPCELYANEIHVSHKAEIHDTFSYETTTSFIEDVYSLLPQDMKEYLKEDYEVLNASSRINRRHDYWRRGVIAKDDLINICNKIHVKTNRQFAEELGGTVDKIFEVAMSQNNDDPLLTKLQMNLSFLINKSNDLSYEIHFNGYNSKSIDMIVDQIYLLKNNNNKSDILPNIVTLTAELWTTIWAMNGNKVEPELITIKRVPGLLDMNQSLICTTKPNGDSSNSKQEKLPVQKSKATEMSEQRRARLQRLERIERIQRLQRIESEGRRFGSDGNLL